MAPLRQVNANSTFAPKTAKSKKKFSNLDNKENDDAENEKFLKVNKRSRPKVFIKIRRKSQKLLTTVKEIRDDILVKTPPTEVKANKPKSEKKLSKLDNKENQDAEHENFLKAYKSPPPKVVIKIKGKSQRMPTTQKEMKDDLLVQTPPTEVRDIKAKSEKKLSKLNHRVNPIAKKDRRRTAPAVVQPFRSFDAPLLLANSEADNFCFANSVVQVTRKMWSQEIQTIDPKDRSRAVILLSKIIATPGRKTLKHLLRQTSGFCDGLQHCAGEYFEELLKKIKVPSINQGMKLVLKDKISCKCDYLRTTQSDEYILRVNSDRPMGTLDQYLATVEQTELLQDSTCGNCGARGTMRHSSEVTLPPSCKSLVVQFTLKGNSNSWTKINRSISLPSFPYSYKGSSWNLQGLVEHHGPYVNNGHYVAWTEENGKWRRYDDTEMREKPTLPRNLSNIVLMFFERV